MRFDRTALAAWMAATVLVLGGSAAFAEDKPAAAATAPAAKAAAPAPKAEALAKAAAAPAAEPDKSATAKVSGFRSALFGMTVDEAVKAIGKDFGVKDADIKRETNPTERTVNLIVRVNDLQAGAGPAVVAYIFGYSSQKLFQINVFWGGAFNPEVPAATLVGTANSLRNYLLAQGYQSKDQIVNLPVGDGSQVIVFRGLDSVGHMTLLTLTVKPKPADAAQPAEPPALQLSYIEKPNEPDIFKISTGF
jgi:hypothetical protein